MLRIGYLSLPVREYWETIPQPTVHKKISYLLIIELRGKLTDTSKFIHSIQSSFKMLATHILVVNIDSVGRKAFQRIRRLLLLVVETRVELEVLEDKVEFLVISNTANDSHTLMFSQLPDKLSHGSRRSRDEDCLALLRLANLVEGRPRCKSGHTESTDEVLHVQTMRVLQFRRYVDDLLGENGVLLGWRGKARDDDIAGGELGRVGLDDLGDGVVGDGLSEFEGGRVGLDVGCPHAAALVGVEGDVVGADCDAALWGALLEVERYVFDGQVLAGYGRALGDLLEDESFILNHDKGWFSIYICGVCCCLCEDWGGAIEVLFSMKELEGLRRLL
jgi:hypothetical protein